MDSDHLPLQVDLFTTSQHRAEYPANRATRLKIPEARTRQFQDTLDRLIHLNTEIGSGADVDDAIEVFPRNIQEAAALSTRNNTNGSASNGHGSQRRHQTLLLDEPTKSLLEWKLRCKRTLIATRTPEARVQSSPVFANTSDDQATVRSDLSLIRQAKKQQQHLIVIGSLETAKAPGDDRIDN
ncbi:hypothetical protein AWZ03_014771 [Drosophila navojoa]|uniref:Uncharacterized protein n=1 Tax=Drosophila navojoa TaxID=7232 RepID=A0A484AQR8_DRONA|nr:hypothetical protein AWZ03_014771 [Drosophila navojoa]